MPNTHATPQGAPAPFPYVLKARYEFEIDGVIAATVLRALAEVAPAEVTSSVAVLAVDAVETSRLHRIEATEGRRIDTLDAISDWDSRPSPWAKVADVAARSLELIDRAGSATLRTDLGAPLQRLAIA